MTALADAMQAALLRTVDEGKEFGAPTAASHVLGAVRAEHYRAKSAQNNREWNRTQMQRDSERRRALEDAESYLEDGRAALEVLASFGSDAALVASYKAGLDHAEHAVRTARTANTAANARWAVVNAAHVVHMAVHEYRSTKTLTALASTD